MSFQDDVANNFDFLFKEYGFKVDKHNADEEISDYVMIAVGQKFSLRFINDRADFFLDLSSNSTPEQWVSFYKVLGKFKKNGLLKEEVKSSNKLSSVKSNLKKYINIILENSSEF